MFARSADLPHERVSIFHTTDLHGNILPTRDYMGNPEFGGLARLATLLRRRREEQPNCLTLDVGDLYQGTDAVILTTHMGGRAGDFTDNEANRLTGVARASRDAVGKPRVHAIIGGHSHQDLAAETVEGIPYTQANFFGSHLGRVDLEFDPETRALARVATSSERITADLPLDSGLIALTRESVQEAEAHLDQPAGEFSEEFSHRRNADEPTDIEKLIGASMLEGLRGRGIEADTVLHGMLFSRAPVSAGRKSIRDSWTVIPFENFIVTAEITLEALRAIASEARGFACSLMGLRAVYEGRGAGRRVTAILDANRRKVEPSRRFILAVNSYDAAGGGRRLTTLRAILSEPLSKRTLHRLQSRALLVEFMGKHSPLAPRQLDV